MLRQPSVALATLLALFAWGCDDGVDPVDSGGGTDSGTTDSGTGDAGPGDDAGMAVAIPDPGTADNDWGLSVFPGSPCCSTPMTAYPVGVVTMDPGYVQGDIDTSVGEFFYVFRTGPSYTTFNWGGGPLTEEVHLHDGAGMVFGPQITPTVSTPTTGTWTVLPDHVYVLHLLSSMGGFF